MERVPLPGRGLPHDDAETDLLTLSLPLSETPCSPLYKRTSAPTASPALVRG